jgi:hypothetical protein
MRTFLSCYDFVKVILKLTAFYFSVIPKRLLICLVTYSTKCKTQNYVNENTMKSGE